ncbi:MAG TPA: flavin reductase family protein [Candidatus Binataceae bacterium]|jgi:flavin reductase (DIM6/NTAB) family NADH-FMN oxidoreductase RutF
MPIEKNQLRQVMGHFATGVTIITTVNKEGQLHGLTANAFTSVSLEPPLLLISVDKKAESWPAFEESKVFTVNILGDDQEALSRKFAVSGGNKFEGVAYRRGANGAAILEGALAFIECTLYAAYEGGDHSLYLGEIQEAAVREGKPLVFFRGGYRNLGD